MRTFLLIILAGLLFTNSNGQTSFSTIESKLTTIKHDDLTELICSSSTISVKFQLKHNLAVSPQNNLVTVDDQTIQITPLNFSGYKKDINSQKAFLETYSKYELEYFKNDLHVEPINPNNQWVLIKSKEWLIWYFRVGNSPIQVDKQMKIQLFASTIIGDKILTINAPILTDDSFNKAGLIVNEMMETLTIIKQ